MHHTSAISGGAAKDWRGSATMLARRCWLVPRDDCVRHTFAWKKQRRVSRVIARSRRSPPTPASVVSRDANGAGDDFCPAASSEYGKRHLGGVWDPPW